MTEPSSQRDSFQSRLGFILVSAGCAIGIGNVWKFPFCAASTAERLSSCCICCSC